MRIHNLYTDADGQSHFRDIEVEWVEERRGSKLSKRLTASGIIFRETQAEHDVDWHPAPRRQYIVNLDAGVKITASDGESRMIGIGEVILVEDTTGKGHLSQHVEGKIRHSILCLSNRRSGGSPPRSACGGRAGVGAMPPPRPAERHRQNLRGGPPSARHFLLT